jgi:hypothetical protein
MGAFEQKRKVWESKAKWELPGRVGSERGRGWILLPPPAPPMNEGTKACCSGGISSTYTNTTLEALKAKNEEHTRKSIN